MKRAKMFAVLPTLLTLGNAACGFGAITFAAKAGDNAALRIANGTFLHWLTRGSWSDGLHWTRVALDQTPADDSALRARMLASAGFFASDLGEAERGIADLEEGLAMARRVDDLHAQGYCASFLGAELSRRDMDLDRGLALLAEAQDIYSQLGEPYGEAWVIRYLGLSYQERGDLDEAIRLHSLSLETFREAGDVWNIRRSQALLAEAMHTIGELSRSRELYEEIAVRAAISTGTAPALEPDRLAVLDAGGDSRLHFSRTLLDARPATGVARIVDRRAGTVADRAR